ncbi:MAG: hypothetical protein M3Z16_03245 [Pseudomonadota bacterium]|nr:hypothetical protein [Pseudomonadota bacterium]
MTTPLFRRRAGRLASAALLGLALAGCYVIPIDPRTGQPYPAVGARDASHGGGNGTTPLALPAPSPTAPTQLAVRLYPLNPQANKAGMLAAQVSDNNAGHGSFSVPYLGDTLQGEASRVDASYASFGHVHSAVLGAAPRAFSGRRGIANAHGSRGVNAQCEYLLTGPSSGTGVCAFSDGANFQMHFGS